MHLLEVDQPYTPDRYSWPEAADYHFRAGQHELRLFVDRPTPKEVVTVEKGPVAFGMFAEPEGLYVVTRFGRSLSFDSSYQWHHVDPAERVAPPPHEETSPAPRAILAIILVNAATGIVRALRVVSYSPGFTRALHRAIADQAAAPFDALAHERWAARMLRFTTAQLWYRCTIRCQVGD
jgi:hypothetical protein